MVIISTIYHVILLVNCFNNSYVRFNKLFRAYLLKTGYFDLVVSFLNYTIYCNTWAYNFYVKQFSMSLKHTN